MSERVRSVLQRLPGPEDGPRQAEKTQQGEQPEHVKSGVEEARETKRPGGGLRTRERKLIIQKVRSKIPVL